MKTVTQEEWGRTPQSRKRDFDGSHYMVYQDDDGCSCFGPVRVERNEELEKPEMSPGLIGKLRGVLHREIDDEDYD